MPPPTASPARIAFGQYLRDRIAALGVTQSVFSERTGFAQAYISRICSGAQVPPKRTVELLIPHMNMTEAQTKEWLRLAGAAAYGEERRYQ